MNFVGEWFGKLVSSEEPDFSDGNTSDNVFNADSNKSETNNGRGSLANILDGFSNIVASVRVCSVTELWWATGIRRTSSATGVFQHL